MEFGDKHSIIGSLQLLGLVRLGNRCLRFGQGKPGVSNAPSYTFLVHRNREACKLTNGRACKRIELGLDPW